MYWRWCSAMVLGNEKSFWHMFAEKLIRAFYALTVAFDTLLIFRHNDGRWYGRRFGNITACVRSPAIWQFNTQPCTLMRIRRETITVTLAIVRTLAHVLLARIEIILRIQPIYAHPEQFHILQRFAHQPALFVTTHRIFRQIVVLSRTGFRATHLPCVRKTPDLVIRIVDTASRNQIVTPHIVVVATQTTQTIFVASGHLNFSENSILHKITFQDFTTLTRRPTSQDIKRLCTEVAPVD